MVPVALYSVMILGVSTIPKVNTPLSGIHFDKVLHLLEYAPFGFLSARAFFNTGSQQNRSKKSILAFVSLLTLLLATCDEILQSFVIGRNSSVVDVMADDIGGILGGWVNMVFYERSILRK